MSNYKTSGTGNSIYSDITDPEKVAYSLKLALSRVTTDAFRPGKEWYTEPELFLATNKKNTLGLPRFHSSGVGNSVPDLFFWDPDYEEKIFNPQHVPKEIHNIRAGFVELKTGDHFGDLVDGVLQNTRYYGYYITELIHI